MAAGCGRRSGCECSPKFYKHIGAEKFINGWEGGRGGGRTKLFLGPKEILGILL